MQNDQGKSSETLQVIQENELDESVVRGKYEVSWMTGDDEELEKDVEALKNKDTNEYETNLKDEEEMAIMRRGLRKMFKELGGLQNYFVELPEKMGHTFEHMKAVLDRRYQAMLKGFNNSQNKIREFSEKLKIMEHKINNNPHLKSLVRECSIYKEFSEILSNDLEGLSGEIRKEERRLIAIHSLYTTKKDRLNVINENNLYLSGVITRLQKHISKNYKHHIKTHYSQYYLSNMPQADNSIDKIERICGASKLKLSKPSRLPPFAFQQYSKQLAESKMSTPTVTNLNPLKTSEDFKANFNSKQSQQSQQSQMQQQSQQQQNDQQQLMSKTANDQVFKRSGYRQVYITQKHSSSHSQRDSQKRLMTELKQTYFSKTDQLFQKKCITNKTDVNLNAHNHQESDIPIVTPSLQDNFNNNVNEYEHTVDEFGQQQQDENTAQISKLEELNNQIEQVANSNKMLKAKILKKSNNFYYSIGLLTDCLQTYKNYLRSNQKIVNTSQGLLGSLYFEITKMNKASTQPLNGFNNQSYKPSSLMDRESKVFVHDTLKQMLFKQLQSKQLLANQPKKIDKNIFLSFTPIQLIGVMTLKPTSFEDLKFIMERKARILQEKATQIQGLKSQIIAVSQKPYYQLN